MTRRITYNKYFHRAHMGEVSGVSNTNVYADAASFAIHTIWPRDNHEVVHLYVVGLRQPCRPAQRRVCLRIPSQSRGRRSRAQVERHPAARARPHISIAGASCPHFRPSSDRGFPPHRFERRVSRVRLVREVLAGPLRTGSDEGTVCARYSERRVGDRQVRVRGHTRPLDSTSPSRNGSRSCRNREAEARAGYVRIWRATANSPGACSSVVDSHVSSRSSKVHTGSPSRSTSSRPHPKP